MYAVPASYLRALSFHPYVLYRTVVRTDQLPQLLNCSYCRCSNAFFHTKASQLLHFKVQEDAKRWEEADGKGAEVSSRRTHQESLRTTHDSGASMGDFQSLQSRSGNARGTEAVHIFRKTQTPQGKPSVEPEVNIEELKQTVFPADAKAQEVGKAEEAEKMEEVDEGSPLGEYGFRYKGPEPTIHGDWSIKGRVSDF